MKHISSQERTNTLTIKTPEGIVFSLPLAGPVTRFFAWSLDLLCILVIASVVNSSLALLNVISMDIARAVSILSYFIISIGYGIVMEWYFRGQTLGKLMFRLRVMDEQGLHLKFTQVVVRNLLRSVDSLPIFYLVGGLSCLITRKAQRLGDMAASTIVIRNPRLFEPDLDQILSDKFNSFKAYPHIAARLRQKVSPKEAGLALQALLRRDEFNSQARIELFKEIASHFRGRVSFPQEATDGISDEQYIRNVVEILFRKR